MQEQGLYCGKAFDPTDHPGFNHTYRGPKTVSWGSVYADAACYDMSTRVHASTDPVKKDMSDLSGLRDLREHQLFIAQQNVVVVMHRDGRMDTVNAAIYLGISVDRLLRYRARGYGPEFIKPKQRIFYYQDDLDAWRYKNT